MGKDPAFLFYPGDWLGGTLTFTRSHKGAYMDLLMAQFNDGHMSLQDIKTILAADYDSMWEQKLKKKFVQDERGLYFNARLEFEQIKRRNYTASRRKNLDKTDTHMSPHMDSHMENRNENKDVIKDKKEKKKKHGEHKNVLLTNKELEKLKDDFGEALALSAIEFLSDGIALKGYKYKSHYLCLRKWPMDEAKKKAGTGTSKMQALVDETMRRYGNAEG